MRSFSLKSLIAFVVLGGVALLFFTECKKDKNEIKTIITVKARWDTLLVIPFADVVIGGDFNDVRVAGQTDATGQFEANFKLEAILDVVASKDTNTGSGTTEPALTGTSVVRLKPGDVIYKTVFIR